MPKCLRCGEELVFNPRKGWVHQDGNLYKMKLKKTANHPEGIMVDDHRAFPNWGKSEEHEIKRLEE